MAEGPAGIDVFFLVVLPVAFGYTMAARHKSGEGLWLASCALMIANCVTDVVVVPHALGALGNLCVFLGCVLLLIDFVRSFRRSRRRA